MEKENLKRLQANYRKIVVKQNDQVKLRTRALSSGMDELEL